MSEWSEFQKRYRQELIDKKDLIGTIKDKEKKFKLVALVYGAKDKTHNQAMVLKEVLK